MHAVRTSRRGFLAGQTALAALAAAGASRPTEAAPPARPALLDPHTHFYDPTRPGGVPWPGRDTPLYRRVLPSDWLAEAAPSGITETIVVEASPLVEDNQWLLDLVPDHPCLVGVVGRLPIGEEGCTKLIDRFAANPKFRGVRIRGDEVVKRWDDASFLRDIERLSFHGLVPDVNGGPVLEACDRLAVRMPQMRVLVEHMAGASIGGQPDPDWVEGLLRVGSRPNAWLKVSNLAESAASRLASPAAVAGARAERPRAPVDPGAYRPWLDVAWEAFGPDRLIFASNWPVCEWAADYATVVGIVRPWIASHGPEAEASFFGGAARRAYAIDAG
jgi:predicted TIM-barrel fold metal-dependent hydrolase